MHGKKKKKKKKKKRLEMHNRFWLKSLKERDHLKDTSTEGRIILKWMLRNRFGGCGLV
jgi:hypothetical protein